MPTPAPGGFAYVWQTKELAVKRMQESVWEYCGNRGKGQILKGVRPKRIGGKPGASGGKPCDGVAQAGFLQAREMITDG